MGELPGRGGKSRLVPSRRVLASLISFCRRRQADGQRDTRPGRAGDAEIDAHLAAIHAGKLDLTLAPRAARRARAGWSPPPAGRRPARRPGKSPPQRHLSSRPHAMPAAVSGRSAGPRRGASAVPGPRRAAGWPAAAQGSCRPGMPVAGEEVMTTWSTSPGHQRHDDGRGTSHTAGGSRTSC